MVTTTDRQGALCRLGAWSRSGLPGRTREVQLPRLDPNPPSGEPHPRFQAAPFPAFIVLGQSPENSVQDRLLGAKRITLFAFRLAYGGSHGLALGLLPRCSSVACIGVDEGQKRCPFIRGHQPESV
jgi:hypothetical protein